MEPPSSTILSTIDRSVDSTPRPPVWLRAMVGAALALPLLVSFALAIGKDPMARMTERSDEVASLNENWVSDGGDKTLVAKAPAKIGKKIRTLPEKVSSQDEPSISKLIKAKPTAPSELTGGEQIDSVFGSAPELAATDPAPAPALPPETASSPSSLPSSPATPAGGTLLEGLDIPGYPDGPNAGLPGSPAVEPLAPVPAPGPESTSPAPPDSVPGLDPEPPAPIDPASETTPATPDSVPGPETRDTVPEPEATTTTQDLRTMMKETRQEVTRHLDERYPMWKPNDSVTVKLATGATAQGKVLLLHDNYLILNPRGAERHKILFTRMSDGSRIRCDNLFRLEEISKETEKRVLDKLN